ncbi:5-formyltetrahydrofolate cyclo-ligase [Parafrankia sp. BMG5.11]|uniref:5-formyltetrahydrofolate cyclo-ligase n=1 Tax=Parafrankia sp. BMG5.11 TaxID=222540 RepID=UPI00103FC225|nr:5-formyltetrahydrofolate cyclo-ligase [Parafrankia sp. BMG5.11]TCJ34710.1 5-formyltetrahydrofolate cyclo-ligase [Parafrankia sp. BMG5.11]
MVNIRDAKQQVRESVWDLLAREYAAAPDVHGYIPAFAGAEQAAERLAALPVWASAQVVKAVPDKAQEPVRARALAERKILYMAVPKLAESLPFRLLDPAILPVPPDQAASRHVAAEVARPVGVNDMRPVDLVVVGSVAVNRHGARLGKGGGYADIEFALLHEAGLLAPTTVIVTTVHDLQVVDDDLDLPETRHDFRVDLVVTPTQVITCGPARRPEGLYWDDLDEATIAAIPVLAAPRRDSGA